MKFHQNLKACSVQDPMYRIRSNFLMGVHFKTTSSSGGLEPGMQEQLQQTVHQRRMETIYRHGKLACRKMFNTISYYWKYLSKLQREVTVHLSRWLKWKAVTRNATLPTFNEKTTELHLHAEKLTETVLHLNLGHFFFFFLILCSFILFSVTPLMRQLQNNIWGTITRNGGWGTNTKIIKTETSLHMNLAF
jgi:hypothetical protein